jgi:ankyrin repeat protein
MRYRKMLAVGAVVVATGLSSSYWWSTHAQGTTMSGFKQYPPEQFFSGQQLELARAIHDGDMSRVRTLAPTANLNVPGNSNMTLLAYAIQEAVPVKTDSGNVRFEVVSQLVKNGAKPEQTFLENDNIAYDAARADTPNFLKALLAGGMSPDIRYDGDTPLLFATASERQLPQMKVLIEHKANVDIRDSLQETAIFTATRLRQWDVVDYLLAQGANPTVHNVNGLTYAKVLETELKRTPKDSPQLERIGAVGKRIVAAGGKWPPA